MPRITVLFQISIIQKKKTISVTVLSQILNRLILRTLDFSMVIWLECLAEICHQIFIKSVMVRRIKITDSCLVKAT